MWENWFGDNASQAFVFMFLVQVNTYTVHIKRRYRNIHKTHFGENMRYGSNSKKPALQNVFSNY